MRRRTIGRLASEAGVTVETVRFYERRGLLARPAMPRRGWREYGADAVSTIHYIKLAQRLGFSLSEIKELGHSLDSGISFCESFRHALADKISGIKEKIELLEAVKRELEAGLDRCRSRTEADGCPIRSSLRAQAEKPGRKAVPSWETPK